MNNYAFIDGINVHMTFEKLHWKIDYGKLRVFLREKYSVAHAYYFIGRVPGNEYLYIALDSQGYQVKLKEVARGNGGKIKGNCDAELILQAMIDYKEYDKAVIISSDGDFSCLVSYLAEKDKLGKVIAPCLNGCSHLLKKAAGPKIDFLENFKIKVSK